MSEIWKDVPGFEGRYQASNLGEIKSLNWEHTKQERILKKKLDRYGYYQVTLFKDGKRFYRLVSRLVYVSFYGEIPDGLLVNHIDECRTNNNITNLNLLTYKENNTWGTAIEKRLKKQKENRLKKLSSSAPGNKEI